MNGILAEMKKLKAEVVTADELETAINSLWGSSLMRQLSRINQAYYMGVYEYLGVGYDHGGEWIDELQQVTAEDVKRVANEYLSTENYIIATAGVKP